MKFYQILAFTLASQLFSIWSSNAQERITIGNPTTMLGPFQIEGIVKDAKSGELLAGATVHVLESNLSTTTNDKGRFYLNLEKGYYLISITFIGYKPKDANIFIRNRGTLTIELQEDRVEMEEIVIYSKATDSNIKSVTLGKTQLSIESIESLPPFAGELDVLKSITLLPGISSVGETSSGFNVRGGGSDQNLILLDKVTLYNPSHLFGFFSSFNSDVISDVTVYKGGIPSNYGGRGSSIIDISYQKGNLEKWEGKGSIGTISTKFQVNGPLVKDRLAIMTAARSSYSNWLLNAVRDPEIGNSAASFYDINALIHFKANSANIIEYSFYHSYDNFRLVNDTIYSWQNMGHVLKWNHSFSNAFSLNLSVVQSLYNFNITNESKLDPFDISSSINEQSVNLDFIKELKDNSSISFGSQGKLIQINPGKLKPLDANSTVVAREVEPELAIEWGLYFQNDLNLIKNKLGISYGLRYSHYIYLGDNSIYTYADFKPRREENITGNNTYNKYEEIVSYNGLEPRIAFRYSLNERSSIKVGFNRINQYIHLISNTATIAPTDIWKLSDPYLLPQSVTQVSAGYYKNFKNNGIETSFEIYYKDQSNIVEYKDGAQLLLNDHLETELLNGQGKSYGFEIYVKRNIGFLRGWVGYTFSRSLRQVIGAFPEELINNGEWFPSNFDKPHDLTATCELQFSPNVKFSGILTYSTGRAISYPAAKFNYFGVDIAYFEARNLDRAPDYVRIDASWTFKFNSKKSLLSGELNFSVFNILGRKNAFSVFFDDVAGAPPQAYKLSILGIPFPSLTYSFKF